jgi:transposase
MNANQVFQWRRLYQSGLLGGTPTNALKLLPVSVTEDPEPPVAEQAEVSVAPATTGSIHIELRKGVRVSLEGAVDPALVRAVLKSLHA